MEPTWQLGAVSSADGTTIGYRSLGQGPGVVVVPGAGQTSENLVPLGQELADHVTVHLADRRGKGLSGPCRQDHGLHTEVEDVSALLEATASHYVIGHSAGAVVAVETAAVRSDVTKLALYEPPLITATTRHGEWVPRYEAELKAGHLGGALVAVLQGTADRTSLLRVLPSSVLATPLNVLLPKAGGKARPGSSPKDLVASVHFDAQVVMDAAGPVERFASLGCGVLLLGGSKSARNLTASLDELAAVLPNPSRVLFWGAGHTAPMKRRWVERVAAQLRAFLLGDAVLAPAEGARRAKM